MFYAHTKCISYFELTLLKSNESSRSCSNRNAYRISHTNIFRNQNCCSQLELAHKDQSQLLKDSNTFLSSPLLLSSEVCGRQQAVFHFIFLWSFWDLLSSCCLLNFIHSWNISRSLLFCFSNSLLCRYIPSLRKEPQCNERIFILIFAWTLELVSLKTVEDVQWSTQEHSETTEPAVEDLLSHQPVQHWSILVDNNKASASEHMQCDIHIRVPGLGMLLLHIAKQQATTAPSVVLCKTGEIRSCRQARLSPQRKSGLSRRCLWFPLHDSPLQEEFSADVPNGSWHGLSLPERCLEIPACFTRTMQATPESCVHFSTLL